MTNIFNLILSNKAGVLISYFGTLLMASATSFCSGVAICGFPSVVASSPELYLIGIGLVGLGFILQFLPDRLPLLARLFSVVLGIIGISTAILMRLLKV